MARPRRRKERNRRHWRIQTRNGTWTPPEGTIHSIRPINVDEDYYLKTTCGITIIGIAHFERKTATSSHRYRVCRKCRQIDNK